jgi:tetratricopeptide (TPR) repeat protein
MARYIGQYGLSRRIFRWTAERSKAVGSPACAVWSVAQEAEVLRIQGLNSTALPKLKMALRGFQDLDHSRGVSWIQSAIAQLAKQEGDEQSAEQTFLAAAAAGRESGDLLGQAWALRGLAETKRRSGRIDEAAQYAADAAELFHRKSYTTGLGYTLKTQAEIALAQGDVDNALLIANQAKQYFTGLGERRGLGYVLKTIAEIHFKRGNRSDALRLARESAQILSNLSVEPPPEHDPRRLISILDGPA